MLPRMTMPSLKIALLVSSLNLSVACGKCPPAPAGASIKIETPARAGSGGPDETDDIKGGVSGVKPTEARVVIYTHAGDRWWIQPLEDAPFTAITSQSQWASRIHLGFEYAALLVQRSYSPPKQPMQLPQAEGCVWAIDIAKGHK